MNPLQRVSEGLARKTTRRGLFGRGWDIAFGALAGAAAGTLAGRSGVSATFRQPTKCSFPGPPCRCDACLSSGVCAKPCIILNEFYAAGCWVAAPDSSITCCDCDCSEITGYSWCGCGSDYHNNPTYCPNGNANS